mmetsp:Transcript_17139/g.57696  ORF Transcript_17139/g.57696 Transcript_17139/m.57696 type:complete len:535 (+) Transcript_17139:124-1728(+)
MNTPGGTIEWSCTMLLGGQQTAKSRRRHERPLWPVGAVARGCEGVAPLLGDQLVHCEVEQRELWEAACRESRCERERAAVGEAVEGDAHLKERGEGAVLALGGAQRDEAVVADGVRREVSLLELAQVARRRDGGHRCDRLVAERVVVVEADHCQVGVDAGEEHFHQVGEAVLADLVGAAAHLLEAAEAAARDRVGDVDDPRVAKLVAPVPQNLELRQVADVEELGPPLRRRRADGILGDVNLDRLVEVAELVQDAHGGHHLVAERRLTRAEHRRACGGALCLELGHRREAALRQDRCEADRPLDAGARRHDRVDPLPKRRVLVELVRRRLDDGGGDAQQLSLRLCRRLRVELDERYPRVVLLGAEVGDDVLCNLAAELVALRDDLLDRERLEVDVEAHLHDQHRLIDGRVHHLEAGKRSEGDLALVRVLREPLHRSAAVDHPHLHLEEHPRLRPLRAARRVELGDVLLERRRHERVLDAAAHLLGVRPPERLGEHRAADAAVHRLGRHQLRQLDDRRVDAVKRCRVRVHRRLRR